MSRVRLSLHEIQKKYDCNVDRTLLENLVRAFRGIQKLPPDDPNSFFKIAGYHGEPFRGTGEKDPSWWGGYCNHGNVLFPTWHRAYLLRLENALRSIPSCENVTIPFMDVLVAVTDRPENPIPSVLTQPQFLLDGETHNPLYSYKLQKDLVENVEGGNKRYSKPKEYETVRYPLSGLVGNPDDRTLTNYHNEEIKAKGKEADILNNNVKAWLKGTVNLDKDPDTKTPDTYSVSSRFRICLDAPNFTVFSNTTSQNRAIKDAGGDSQKDHFFVSLESPHNAIHLAIGGFWQYAAYNADEIRYANGDMGDNETASFDPIFYFHHAFIDYVFWTWQKKHHLTAAGSLSVIEDDPGTIVQQGSPGYPPGTILDMQSPLYPFKKPKGGYYTPDDVTDIVKQLGYDYGVGSLSPGVGFADAPRDPIVPPFKWLKVDNINRKHYAGSFVVRTYAKSQKFPNGIEIGRDAILSRWNVEGCANCQSHLNVQSWTPLNESQRAFLKGGDVDAHVEYYAHVQTHKGGLPEPSVGVSAERTPRVQIVSL